MPRYLQLNNYTQYKVILYGLIALVVYSILLSVFGLFAYSTLNLLVSISVLVAVCFLANYLIAKFLNIPANSESYLITALILFFVINPASDLQGILTTSVISLLAISSKYLIKLHKRHIFNPAAFGALALTLFGIPAANWWIANPIMMPAVVLVGFLVVRKVRRFIMLGAFFVFATIAIFYFGLDFAQSPQALFMETWVSWPIIFFGTIMFTEPRTAPGTFRMQLAYAAVVGILFGSSISFGPIHSTPEFALVIGNVFAWAVSPKWAYSLVLKKREEFRGDLYNFIFESSEKLDFEAGQFMEWTLGHKSPDSRGNRRYFSIASSPTEDNVQLGVKITKDSSSFKKALLKMKKGGRIMASHVSGDFVLPADAKARMVLIAGGIGITPIRSMMKYLADQGERRDLVVFYAASTEGEFIYRGELDKFAERIGAKINYLITKKENAPKGWRGKIGYLSDEMINEIPKHKACKYYLSGPNAMVDSYKKLLVSSGVARRSIITDYFPGY